MNTRGGAADGVGGGVCGHGLSGLAGLPRSAAVGGLLPPAHLVSFPAGSVVGTQEFRDIPRHLQRIHARAGDRSQVAHRRGRPVERDFVGGRASAGGGGDHRRDNLGGLRGQADQSGGFPAGGRVAVHRHRCACVAGGRGDFHPGHVQRRHAFVPEGGDLIIAGICLVGSSEDNRVVVCHHRIQLNGDRHAVLVGHRQRTQCRIPRHRCRLHLYLLAFASAGAGPDLYLVDTRGGEASNGVGTNAVVASLHALSSFAGLPQGAVVGGLLPPAHPIFPAEKIGA